MSRITLPNGATCTPLNVWPSNWRTARASLNKPWYITYRYHIQGASKLIHIKGMNGTPDLKERQAITQALIDSEMRRLLNGYNPLTKVQEDVTPAKISPQSLVMEGLRGALKDARIVKSTRQDMESMLRRIDAACSRLGFGYIPVKEIKRRHVLLILRDCERNAKVWSGNTFNKYRAYLMTLFKILVRYEAIEVNPVMGIDKETVIREQRRVLTAEERGKVRTGLSKDPALELFVQIFFHSGARIIELCNLKREAVDLDGMRFKCLVKKGKQYREIWRPIKAVAAPYWSRAVDAAGAGEYLFSSRIQPGKAPGDPSYIAKRWRRLVKHELGVGVDLYSLKHLNLTEVSELLGAQAAAGLAGHTNTAMVAQVYDIGYQKRQDERIRNVGNEF